MPRMVRHSGRRALMAAQPLDGLHRRAHVVRVAGAHRKDQRIEDEVALGQPVFPGEQREGALGDL